MIIDGHVDAWTDVTLKREAGGKDVIRNFHYKKMMGAGVQGGVFVVWVDPQGTGDPKARTLDMVRHMAVEITENRDIMTIIKKPEDIDEAVKSNKLAILSGMEGLSGIGTEIDYLNVLYLMGMRIASLTWNEQNDLATGVRGDVARGLTEDGVRALERMEQLGMIVDVSHANEKTFWGIMENTKKPLLASHSNCKALCGNKRNLTDEQLKAIAERGGTVGLNAYSAFVHDDHSLHDAEHLLDHIDHMVKVVGIEHVAFGFDFIDYLPDETLDSFMETEVNGTKGFEDVTKMGSFLDLMVKRGYKDDEIEKISSLNLIRIMKEIL